MTATKTRTKHYHFDVELADGGQVEVVLSSEAVQQFAERAGASARGRARGLNGGIVARVVRRAPKQAARHADGKDGAR